MSLPSRCRWGRRPWWHAFESEWFFTERGVFSLAALVFVALAVWGMWVML